MISRPNRKYNKNIARRKEATGTGSANELTPRTPIIPTFGKPSTTHITVTFDGPVTFSGTPGYVDNAATPHVVSAAGLTAPNVATITLNGNASTTLTVPFQDPAFRNNVGGYVQPGTYTFPT